MWKDFEKSNTQVLVIVISELLLFFIWVFGSIYLAPIETEPYNFVAVISIMHIILEKDLREGC